LRGAGAVLVVWLWRHLEEVLAGLCLAVVVAIVSVNVFMRYALQDSLEAASEVATILFVWTVMLGIGAAARRRLHPSIDALTRLLPVRVEGFVRILIGLILVYLLGDMTLSSWNFAWGSGSSRFTSTLGLTYTVVYLALPVGFFLMLVRVLVCLLDDVRAWRKGERVGGGGEGPEMEGIL
jgi:TRAP-type C4-dicarboxylate transport system permease small subunit